MRISDWSSDVCSSDLPPGAPLLSPFLLWRVVLVSVLFAAIVLSIFFGMLERGADLPTARTMVVNMLIVAEIAYLFNVRFLHMRSLTLRGAMGTPAVLLAIAVVVLAQLAFTLLPVKIGRASGRERVW